MLSDQDFVRQSLELNLFFMRIAKEHAFFLEAAFPSQYVDLIRRAEELKRVFVALLTEAVCLADGVLPEEFLQAGEIVTDLTLEAERGSEFYSGYDLNTAITGRERSLSPAPDGAVSPVLMQEVAVLNQRAERAAREIIDFKARLLENVLRCQIFTFNYPLLIDHILREARFYLELLERIQDRTQVDMATEAVRQQAFWNRIMAEHAKFIRGLVDPTEVKLFTAADNFGHQFDALTAQAVALINRTSNLPAVTGESLKAAVAIRDFKRQGAEGLIMCRIRSIAHPLLGDHVVREANHYIRLLKIFERELGPGIRP
ncbi:MAG: DUF2935 domain-containing protein [Bacillota bacterium]